MNHHKIEQNRGFKLYMPRGFMLMGQQGGWRPGVMEHGGFRRAWQFTSIHRVQLDQDEKLGSVQMNTTHSKIGTSEILQSDQAPKETNKQTNKNTPKLQNMKGIIYILYLVLAPILCFKN